MSTASKSSPTITIQDHAAAFTTPEGKTVSLSLQELFGALASDRAAAGGIHPAGVRMTATRGSTTIWVYEIPPGLRQLKWIADDSPAPFGPGATYRMARLALPYVVMIVVFSKGMLTNSNECFFRVRPLGDETRDELCYPALLNCSRFKPQEGKPLSWICTAKLDRKSLQRETNIRLRMHKGLAVLVRCLLESGSNFSSEHHEYSSWFTESRGVDPRVKSVEAWEKASQDDPMFVLDVPWIKTGKTLEQVVERVFSRCRTPSSAPVSAGDLSRIIANHSI